MRITKVETFQLGWGDGSKPAGRSAFVRIHTDDGLFGKRPPLRTVAPGQSAACHFAAPNPITVAAMAAHPANA